MINPLITHLQTLRHIPEAEQQLILSAFELKSFKAGEYLLHPGQVSRQLYFVCKGVLKIFLSNDNGPEIAYFFWAENRFVTILKSFLEDLPSNEGIQVASDAELMMIGKKDLLALYQQLPYLKEINEHLNQQSLFKKIAIRNSYLGHDSAERYRLFLEHQADIALRISLGDVASYLGITPQSLSRIRRNIR